MVDPRFPQLLGERLLDAVERRAEDILWQATGRADPQPEVCAALLQELGEDPCDWADAVAIGAEQGAAEGSHGLYEEQRTVRKERLANGSDGVGPGLLRSPRWLDARPRVLSLPARQRVDLDPGKVTPVSPRVEESGHEWLYRDCVECQIPDDDDVLVPDSESIRIPPEHLLEAVYRHDVQVCYLMEPADERVSPIDGL